MACTFIGVLCFGGIAFANPQGGEVMQGSAGISSSGNTCTVQQNSDKAILNWQNFSISEGELTKFIQPNSTSAALNRVLSGNPSAIMGTLQANGQIYLINPNGIVVGPNGVINTQGFVGSTLDISNEEFLNGGDLNFIGDSKNKIQNFGKIETQEGGVFLIARQIENAGEIKSDGAVGLAAGTEVLLQPAGSNRITIKAGEITDGTGIENSGMIEIGRAHV